VRAKCKLKYKKKKKNIFLIEDANGTSDFTRPEEAFRAVGPEKS